MAKELPYFKFYVSEWADGDVTLLSYAAQGLFVNICSYYWSKKGVVELSKIKRRYKDASEATLTELLQEGIIKIDEHENIGIKFLDEQLEDRGELSIKRSEAAHKRWNNANALDMDTNSKPKGMLLRGEEKRGKKKRGENNSASYDTQFALFWKHYKKKKSKQRAKKAFVNFMKRSQGDADEVTLKLIKKVNEYFTELELKKKYGVWVPESQYPATWLNNKTYQDKFMTTKEEIFAAHPEAMPKEETSHIALESPFKKTKQS